MLYMKPACVAALFCLFLYLSCAPLFSQDVANAPSVPTVPNLPDVNPRLLQLVIQDQWDRGNDMFSGKQIKIPRNLNVAERDAERQGEVRKMLAQGQISTGQEYYFAELIFQHTSRPEDLMLAHTLAVTAMTKEYVSARWMAAATLDRYLWSINRPQVFGTQFKKGADEKWTMEPYDRHAVSDSIRGSWCVISLPEQEKILRDSRNGGRLASTQTPACK